MRTFRGMKVLEWRTITHNGPKSDEYMLRDLNTLMDEYEVVDCQYAVGAGMGINMRSVLVLIAEKQKMKTFADRGVKKDEKDKRNPTKKKRVPVTDSSSVDK
jgi:hypothetical protein